MAVYTSNATGVWSAGATWVGGVKPPSAAGHSIVIAGAHTVTFDEAGTEYGDDTSTAVVVQGVLYSSRAMNTDITIVGTIGTGTAGKIDGGDETVSDNITNGTYTATFILNKSAAMANYKYGMSIADTSYLRLCGKDKTRNSLTTNSVAVGGTTVDVDDITGWAVGDWIVMAETDGTYNHHDRKQIATLTPGVGTAGTITFTATTYAHGSGCPIGNLSSNVTVKSYNTTNPAFLFMRNSSTTSNDRRSLKNVSFEYVGSDSSNSAKYFISGSTSVTRPLRVFDSCSFYNGNNFQNMFINANNFDPAFAITNLAVLNDAGGVVLYTASGTSIRWTDSVVYSSGSGHIQSGFSQGGQGCTFERLKLWSSNGWTVVHNNGDQMTYNYITFHQASTAPFFFGSGTAFLNNCNFGDSTLPGTPTCVRYVSPNTTSGQAGVAIATDCTFGTPTVEVVNTTLMPVANRNWRFTIANKNGDPDQQINYVPGGVWQRDVTTKLTGVRDCVKMTPISATVPLTFTRTFPGFSGVPQLVTGKINRDTANTATVVVSGLGITPITYTCTGAINTEEVYSITATPTFDGVLTATYSVTGTTGNMWVGDHSAPQSSAINTGQDTIWYQGQSLSTILTNFASGGDVWNYLLANANVTGSFGVLLKKVLTVAKFIGLMKALFKK